MPNNDNENLDPAGIAGRAMALVFGIAFGGIGLAVMGFLWTDHGFGEPPTFFKVFGTFVALPFVGFGVIAVLGGLGVKGLGLKPPSQRLAERAASLAEQMRQLEEERRSESNDIQSAPATNYTCPHCGAPLASSSEASPHGDVKCSHCKAWFNIYGK